MKQHLTEINGRPLLFVELPMGATPISISDKEITCSYECGLNLHKKQLPEGNWKLYGSPFSLSEEKAKELVEEVDFPEIFQGYKDYLGRKYWLFHATESWHSFLESEKVFDKNPFKQQWPTFGKHGMKKFKQWQEAEQRVFRNSVLLAEVKK